MFVNKKYRYWLRSRQPAKMRGKTCVKQVKLGFGSALDWLNTLHEFLEPIIENSRRESNHNLVSTVIWKPALFKWPNLSVLRTVLVGKFSARRREFLTKQCILMRHRLLQFLQRQVYFVALSVRGRCSYLDSFWVLHVQSVLYRYGAIRGLFRSQRRDLAFNKYQYC